MAKEGGFFSPNRKVSGKDKQVASSMSAGSYGGYIDAGESRGFVSPEQADKMIKNPEAYKMRPSETRYLRESMGLPRAQFFNPSGNEIGQIASATTDLSGTSEEDNYRAYMKEQGIRFPKSLSPMFHRLNKENMMQDIQEGRFKDGQFFNKAPVDTDTKIAGAFGMSDDEIERRKNLNEIINTPGYDPKSVTEAQRQLIRLNQGLSPFDKKVEAPKENILQKVGGFLANTFTGTQPVAAGTLDANQQVAQVSERPKLNYVNPDATRMSVSEMADAFKPKNLFGYKDKFGRFDDPGSPLARDRAATIQRVATNFSSPIVGDARTIGQIRADQDARMRENARLRNESFQRGERVQQKSADVTYGTNMLSNPAFGFRDKMSDAAKAQYDKSARDATEMARTDPSLGNVLTSGVNFLKGQINKLTGETPLTREKSLEKIGERQLRLANKEINRPTYQKEAFARNFLGITNDQLKAKNLQQIRANAYARNQAFQNEKAQRALEKSTVQKEQNTMSETSGQRMPSNPKGFSGYSRKSTPSTGTGTGTSPSRSRPGSKKASRGSSPGSRSRGGTGTGGSKAKASGSRGQGGGTASRSKGGSFGGSRRSTNRSKSRRRCDVRTKIDITSLTNQNLIKDDLATVAYFVQELRGE